MKKDEADALVTTLVELKDGPDLITYTSRGYWKQQQNSCFTNPVQSCGCAAVEHCPNLMKCKGHKNTQEWEEEVRKALYEKYGISTLTAGVQR